MAAKSHDFDKDIEDLKAAMNEFNAVKVGERIRLWIAGKFAPVKLQVQKAAFTVAGNIASKPEIKSAISERREEVEKAIEARKELKKAKKTLKLVRGILGQNPNLAPVAKELISYDLADLISYRDDLKAQAKEEKAEPEMGDNTMDTVKKELEQLPSFAGTVAAPEAIQKGPIDNPQVEIPTVSQEAVVPPIEAPKPVVNEPVLPVQSAPVVAEPVATNAGQSNDPLAKLKESLEKASNAGKNEAALKEQLAQKNIEIEGLKKNEVAREKANDDRFKKMEDMMKSFEERLKTSESEVTRLAKLNGDLAKTNGEQATTIQGLNIRLADSERTQVEMNQRLNVVTQESNQKDEIIKNQAAVLSQLQGVLGQYGIDINSFINQPSASVSR